MISKFNIISYPIILDSYFLYRYLHYPIYISNFLGYDELISTSEISKTIKSVHLLGAALNLEVFPNNCKSTDKKRLG